MISAQMLILKYQSLSNWTNTVVLKGNQTNPKTRGYKLSTRLTDRQGNLLDF